jgi:hypothetical protein
MAPDRVRDALQAMPFKPFTVEIAGEKRIPVKHPDFSQLSPAGRTLVVFGDNDEWMEIIDVFPVANVSFGRAKAVRRR